mgnify:CR=1 FL=1
MAARAGATYVSPFIGRLDDIGENGVALVENMVKVFRQYNLDTQIIAASIRNMAHVEKSYARRGGYCNHSYQGFKRDASASAYR